MLGRSSSITRDLAIRAAALGLLLAAFAALAALPARAAGPASLSADRSRVDIRSTAGSGIFGSWFVDGFGLPAYRYRLDPDHDPRVRQPGLNNPTDAWHQLGNDHVVAIAHTRGYVQLWSQDRSYQWVNQLDPSAHQYAGGYGFLRTTGGRVISTLYSDRAAGARVRSLLHRHRNTPPYSKPGLAYICVLKGANG